MQINQVKTLDINGCYEITPKVLGDNRGMFVKTFHKEFYRSLGLNFEIGEEYFSISTRNTLRGMHFQIPPYEHYKLVYCIQGAVQDAFLDIRKNSSTYKRSFSLTLDEKQRNILVLPPGIAHGFLTLSSQATMIYKTSSIYSPEHDKGIYWQDCGINWQNNNPILSERDKRHPKLSEFETTNPFKK